MWESNQIVAEILQGIQEIVSPEITTIELEKYTESEIKRRGVKPAFKGYSGFPCCLCTSINEEVVHGIPSKERILKEGDLLSLDLGVIHEGFYGDSALTIPVGKISREAQDLIDTTRESLLLGIKQAQKGNRVSDISVAVQSYAESKGFSVVKEFVGHGVGRNLHEGPQIPNFGVKGTGPKLAPGMVLAIEPMINAGGSDVEVLADGWTAVTRDRKLSAHFEHSVAVTENGNIILSEPSSASKKKVRSR